MTQGCDSRHYIFRIFNYNNVNGKKKSFKSNSKSRIVNKSKDRAVTTIVNSCKLIFSTHKKYLRQCAIIERKNYARLKKKIVNKLVDLLGLRFLEL